MSRSAEAKIQATVDFNTAIYEHKRGELLRLCAVFDSLRPHRRLAEQPALWREVYRVAKLARACTVPEVYGHARGAQSIDGADPITHIERLCAAIEAALNLPMWTRVADEENKP